MRPAAHSMLTSFNSEGVVTLDFSFVKDHR